MQSSPESAPQDDKDAALEAVARPLPPMTIAQNVALMRQFSRTKVGKTSISLSVMLAVAMTSMWQLNVHFALAMVIGCSFGSMFFMGPFANYRRFSSMELPARSPEVLQGRCADQDEALPAGMRPIARELHGVLSSLEARFDELYGRLLSDEVPSDDDVVRGAIDTHDFAIWLSRWDTLDEEALAVAERRGFSIEKIRALLAGQRSPEVMARDGVTLAAGLNIVRFSSEHPDNKALEAIRSRVGSGGRVAPYQARREVKVKQKLLKAQVEHLRAVIMELRRIDDALRVDDSHPYR